MKMQKETVVYRKWGASVRALLGPSFAVNHSLWPIGGLDEFQDAKDRTRKLF